jgi:hypothetical protein
MGYSPSWEPKRSSSSEEIAHFLWNLNVHYLIHKFSPHVLILSRMTPIHGFPSRFLKMHFNIILPCMPRSSKWSLCLSSSHQNRMHTPLVSHMFYWTNIVYLWGIKSPRSIGFNPRAVRVKLKLEKLTWNRFFGAFVFSVPIIIPLVFLIHSWWALGSLEDAFHRRTVSTTTDRGNSGLVHRAFWTN